MYRDLSKKDKKVAREIIEKGLRKEMENNLRALEAIIAGWKANGSDVKETYYNMYKTLTDFDRHVARRYDGMTGSNYLWIMIEQYREGLLTDEDLQDFLPSTQEFVKNFNPF